MRSFSNVARCGCALVLGAILSESSTARAAGGSAPVITSVNWTYEARVGTGAPLQVTASGTAPLSYQWQRSGVDIPGATNASYVFIPAHCRDSASIGVTVTNEFGIDTLTPRSVTAFGCLQELIDAAAPGSTLLLPAEGYLDSVHIDKDLTIEGAGVANTVISGFWYSNVFSISTNASVVMRHLQITQGYAERAPGGGIHNLGSTLLEDCLLANNLAASGGAVANEGMMTLTNCVVQGNGTDAGALLNRSGTLVVYDTEVTGNGAGCVGVLQNFGTMRMRHCTIHDNHSNEDGIVVLSNGGVMEVIDSSISNNVGRYFSSEQIANGALLTMSNTLIHGNYSGYGGAIRNGGPLFLFDCTVSTNSSGYDFGGIRNYAEATLVRCKIQGNGAGGSRGGIGSSGTLKMTDCEITGNQAGGDPGASYPVGGILVEGGVASLSGCTISSNSGVGFFTRFAGGIGNRGALAATNCTISGNNNIIGAGINNLGTLTLASCTVYGNQASQNGGLHNEGNATLANCIVAGNISADAPANDISGSINSLGYNLIQDTNGALITNVTTGNLYSVDPLLGPLQTNGGLTRTHALLPGSPAIDAGPPTDFPATDQRGFGRPVDGDGDGVARADIGAFEFGHLRFVPTRRVAAGQLQLRGCIGVPGEGYVLDASSDLWNWSPLSTNSADASGWFNYPVTPGDPPTRFYRLRQP